jgi:hypothetical protein
MRCPDVDAENQSAIKNWQLEVRGDWIGRGSHMHPPCFN